MSASSVSPQTRVLVRLALLFCLSGLAPAAAAQTIGLLAPIKTDTPRDTMRTYFDAMNDYKRGLASADKQLMRRLDDAVRCFDFPESSVAMSRDQRREVAVLLREVIDRVIVIDYDLIVDDPTVLRWRLKGTAITIVRIEEGERRGEFLFSKDTVRNVGEFYQRVQQEPYLAGTGGGAGYREPWVARVVPKWSRDKFIGLENWQWIGLFVAILVGLIIKTVGQHILRLIEGLTSRSSTQWDDRIMVAVRRPGGWLLASLFWFSALHILLIPGVAFSILSVIVRILVSISVIWVIYRLADVVTEYLVTLTAKTESDLDDHLVPLVNKAMKIFIVIFGVLVTFQNLGVNVMSVLAGLGLGGLAFALAARDTCANFFGSIMIFLDRPFTIGDWVIIGSHEGSVEEIGFRSTRIRTFYNSLITVPNAEVANAYIDNMGRREYRRIKAFFGLTYDTPAEKVEAFLEGVKNIVEANPYTRKDYYHVVFNGYGASSLDIMLYCFLKVPDWSTELVERQHIYLEILRLAGELGVDFAFPTQSLHIETMPEKKPVRQPHDVEATALAATAAEFGPQGSKSRPDGSGLFVPPYEMARGNDDGK